MESAALLGFVVLPLTLFLLKFLNGSLTNGGGYKAMWTAFSKVMNEASPSGP